MPLPSRPYDEETEEELPGVPPAPQSEILRLRDELMPRAKAPKPTGYGEGLGDADLLEAQRKDRSDQASRDMSNALYSAFSRTPLKREDVGNKNAGALLQRRGAMDQETARTSMQAKAQSATEDDDPNSESSQRAQALLKRLNPALAVTLETQGTKMSAAQMVKWRPELKEMIEAETKRATAKKQAGLDSAGEAAVDREILKIDPSFDPSGMPYEVKKAILDAKMRSHSISNTEHHQSIAEKQGATRLANQERQLDQGDTRLGLRGQMQGFHVSQSDVPGVGPDDAENPHALTSGQAVEFQHQRAAVESAQSAIDFTKAQLAKYGRRLANPLDKEAQTALGVVRSRITEALPQLSAANGFGNPTVSHIELSHASLGGDPTEFINLFNQGRLPAVLDSVMESAKTRYGASLHAAGQHALAPGESRHKSPFAPTLPGAPPAAGASGKVTVSNGTEKHVLINPTERELAEAAAEGFKAVR